MNKLITMLLLVVALSSTSCVASVSRGMSKNEMHAVMVESDGLVQERDEFLGRTSYWGPMCEITDSLFSFTKMWLRMDELDKGGRRWVLKLYHCGGWVGAMSARDQHQNRYQVESTIDHFASTPIETDFVILDGDVLAEHAESQEPLRLRLYGPSHYREEIVPGPYIAAFVELMKQLGSQ